jgi:periplasmic protein TonB
MIQDAATTVLAPPSPTGVPFATDGTGPISSLFDNLANKPSPPRPAVLRPPDKPTAPLLQGGRVQAAKLIKQVIPEYPALAKQARISGTVRLQGLIAKDGTIKDLQLISGHPLLVQAALQAVRQWVYRPTTLNGETVEVAAPIDVIFTLNQ